MEDILEVDKVPVILLSGYGRDEIIARAFERGASDYVVKPFSPTELVARIQATLRKQADPDRAEPDQPYVLGDLTINYEQRRVTVAGRRCAIDREGVSAPVRAVRWPRPGVDSRRTAAADLGPI